MDRTMNAQERKGDSKTQEQTCPNCNMPKNEWMGNNKQGFQVGDKTYCCQGCAIGTGCTCQ